LNQSGFCAFDPRGENNKVTGINQTCGVEVKTEEDVTLEGVDLSTLPTKNIGSKDTVILIGCYSCDYTRKAYPDIQRLVKEKKTNYVFVDFPVKENTNYSSEVDYCVYKEYGERFWEFSDYLFTVDKVEIYEPDYMNKIFKNFDFDVNIINECISNPQTKEIVNDQVNELRKTHLYGTPTVFINGKALVGPKPYRVYRSILNKFIIF
jgi:protein-disulfide isomerase